MPDEFRFTPIEIDTLDDHAFLLVKPGGARDSEGKTRPRPLRIGPHHEPSQRRIGLDLKGRGRLHADHDRRQERHKGKVSRRQVLRLLAEVNAGRLPLSRQERVAAWNHLAQHAEELGIRTPPKRF